MVALRVLDLIQGPESGPAQQPFPGTPPLRPLGDATGGRPAAGGNAGGSS